MEGWSEGAVTAFDKDNLYVKINGRADFFLSKGFSQLFFVSLSKSDETVDIEMYDMGSPTSAVDAFSAERREGCQGRLP